MAFPLCRFWFIGGWRWVFTVNNWNTIVNVIGITYGLTLILATFVRSKVTEALRIDALFIPHPTDSTRPLNLIVGLLVAGYGIYSLAAK